MIHSPSCPFEDELFTPIGVRVSLFVLLMVLWRLICGEAATISSSEVCPVASVADLMLRFQDVCTDSDSLSNVGSRGGFMGFTEGDEDSLQRALDLVHKKSPGYVAVLFYASWCPFSRTTRPTFSVLSSLYPTIFHFAIEESSISPRTLSKYRVHGFPTLFLLNSTTRVRYHGSRTINLLVTFYHDVTGIKQGSLDVTYMETIENPPNVVKLGRPDQESSSAFSWAWFPNNLLHQDVYLGLAAMFVLLRMMYFYHTMLLDCALSTWRRHIRDRSLVKLWEHPLAYLSTALQVLSVLKQPCKKSNLQEGALNAGVWASKSLASVSIGDASTHRGCFPIEGL